jgi:hypothetical protein
MRHVNSLKICWDNLEHIVLMPGRNTNIPRWVYYEDPKNVVGAKGEYVEAENPCEVCGEAFLKKKGVDNARFCSDECKEDSITPKGPDMRLKENGGGWYWKEHRVGHIPWNKGAGVPEGFTNYKRNKQSLEWFVEVRPNPENELMLQTKCCICEKWFDVSIERVKNVKEFVYGYGDKSTWGFYCSDECKAACPYFGKSVEVIMKQDYLNGPSAKYSEKHSISEKVLYYDWQDDLKALQVKLRESAHKRREKHKLRRRKKTELEKQRMAAKRAKKKLKEDPRTPRLKRLLYLSRQRAKQKGWAHDLDFEWLIENTPEVCPKCDIPFDFNMERNMNPWAPSIDRIDRARGYTKDNCIVVSWMYNCGKNCYDEKTLYIICKTFLQHFDHDNP